MASTLIILLIVKHNTYRSYINGKSHRPINRSEYFPKRKVTISTIR